MARSKSPGVRVAELHNEALDLFNRLEKIIDELKFIESPVPLPDRLNAILNIEDWLGQLSGRAHVRGSRARYLRESVHDE